MNVDGGYFLNEDVRQFDNEFFGINNFEAVYGTSFRFPLTLLINQDFARFIAWLLTICSILLPVPKLENIADY